MDLERIKQNLLFRTGRMSTNMSKRFPTREQSPETLQLNPRRQIKAALKVPDIPKQSTDLSNNLSKAKTVTTSSSQKPAPISPSTNGHVPEERQAPILARNISGYTSSGEADYDLRPPLPPPKRRTTNSSLESLSELLNSEAYLRTLTNDSQLLGRFTAFLDRYKPEISQVVLQYLETQKVLKAVHYANAVAASIETRRHNFQAAEINASFKSYANDIFITLLSVTVTAWVTYNLVKAATSLLLAEVTNQATPLTRNLARCLSEVFCLTDPNRGDNPIIYASQEFYRLTGYGHKDVIGYNCRFLQGPKTDPKSVERLGKAIKNGEKHSEMLLNYRTDGRPFINVLMLAPLLDDKGKVKYYLGAQLDATRLVETGRGVDGFEQFLARRDSEFKRGSRKSSKDQKKVTLEKLRDLSLTFDLEESAVVQTNSRRNSMDSDNDDDESVLSTIKSGTGKRVILDGEVSPINGPDDDEDNE